MRNTFIIVFLAGILSFPTEGQGSDTKGKSLPEMVADILAGDCREPTAGEAVEKIFSLAPEADIVDIVAAVLEICIACPSVQDVIVKATELAPEQEADILKTAIASLEDPNQCALKPLASPLCSELTKCTGGDLASPN